MRGLLFIIICSSVTACNYNNSKQSPAAPNAPQSLESLITADLVMSFSLHSCKNCHTEFADASGIRAKLNDVLSEVESDFMPKPDKGDRLLTACQKSALRKWANLGAPDTTTIQLKDLSECQSSQIVKR